MGGRTGNSGMPGSNRATASGQRGTSSRYPDTGFQGMSINPALTEAGTRSGGMGSGRRGTGSRNTDTAYRGMGVELEPHGEEREEEEEVGYGWPSRVSGNGNWGPHRGYGPWQR